MKNLTKFLDSYFILSLNFCTVSQWIKLKNGGKWEFSIFNTLERWIQE